MSNQEDLNLSPEDELSMEMRMDAAYLGEWFARLDVALTEEV